MQIYAIGLHHHNVSEELWRQAPVGRQALTQHCEQLAALHIKKEALFVSSSHSIEVFAVLEDDPQTKETLTDFIAQSLQPANKRAHLPFHNLEGPDAVRHFLHLTMGVEPLSYNRQDEFLENTSRSIAIANECGSAGVVLNRLYQTALMLTARVEQSGLAFDYSFMTQQIETLAQKIFGALDSAAFMVVGTNALNEKLLKPILTQNLGKVFCVHGSRASDSGLPAHPAGQRLQPGEINEHLVNVQVVLRMSQECADAFSTENLQKIMSRRKNQPLLIINLDTTIAPKSALNKLYNLFVYDLADFQQQEQLPDDGIAFTKDLIENEMKKFFTWFYSKEHYRFGDIIGKSKSIEHILELIARISQTNITVLIEGESGTGKELVARALHENSPRRMKPFISVNCGALPDTLLESELFGHERGAFTGATEAKRGLLEEADAGTLMLDEIGDTSPDFQVKLLRVLQEGEMRRVGSTRFQKIDVRIIAATNRRLHELVKQGAFRKDLYYRLNVINIDLPPLRERREDISLLIEHFIANYSEKMKKRVTGLKNETRELLLRYPWPGNVRELENAIEHAVALCIGHSIIPEDLPASVRISEPAEIESGTEGIVPLRELEKQHIARALQHYQWDYDLVARVLGIGRTTLWRKIKEYAIEKPEGS